MGAYEYVALDGEGRKRKGLIEGDTARQARQHLRGQGLIPISIDTVSNTDRKQQTIFSTRKISVRDLALVTRQLATLIRSGLPLEESLLAISQQTEKARVNRVILGVRSQVLEGRSLANSLGQFPNAFPVLYRATVEAGEASAKLDLVLEKLAEYMESRERLHQKIQLALLYPVLLTLVSIAVIVGLLVFVVPEIVSVFDNTGQALPLLTQWLIDSSDFFREYGLFLLSGCLLGWFLWRLGMRIRQARTAFHLFLLKLPLVGRFVRGSNTARFTRTLAILTSSGVTLLDALKIAGQVLPNLPMRQAVEIATAGVREGESLHGALQKSRLFAPISLHLIHSGEMSGHLPEMLESASENQELEVQSMTDLLVGISEPVLIMFMGGVVLTIVMAILLPIFDMNQLVG